MLSRLLFIVGIAILAWGAWLVAPLVRAYATEAVVWGKILDVVILPDGDGQGRFIVQFEYPVPGGDARTWAQGSAQADARLMIVDQIRVPMAEAVSLRQRLLEYPKRRVFLPSNPPGAEPFIISEAAAGGLGYRQGLFIALAGSLLMTMAYSTRRQRGNR